MGNNFVGEPPKTQFEIHIREHGPVTQLAPNLWFAYGTFGKSNDIRNMIIYKMKNDKGLWLYSTVALVEEEMKKIEAIGKPAFINVPNGYHRLDCAVYKRDRYPDAKVICPKGAKANVEKKIAVDVVDEDENIFAGTGIKLVNAIGKGSGENVYELDISDSKEVVENGDKALVFGDFVFNHMPNKGSKFVRWLENGPAGNGGFLSPVPKLFRSFLFTNYDAFAADMVKRIDQYGNSLKVITFAHDYHLITQDKQKPHEILKALFTSTNAAAAVPEVPPYLETAFKPVPASRENKYSQLQPQY